MLGLLIFETKTHPVTVSIMFKRQIRFLRAQKNDAVPSMLLTVAGRIVCLTSTIQVETTSGESPFTQSIRVALAAVCKCYDPDGNNLFNDLIGAPEAVNGFDCLVVGIRHQFHVRRFKHRVADE
jgi:hypothetical protein